jgi:hypothetical protein
VRGCGLDSSGLGEGLILGLTKIMNRDQYRLNSNEICGDRSGSGAGLSLSFLLYLAHNSIIAPLVIFDRV